MRYMIETERSDLFDVSIVIAMRVHIKGHVNEDGLRSAFEEATKADVGYAVDYRKDGNRCMSNQATGISIKYAYNYNKSFQENAIKVQKLMTKKLEDEQSKEFILPFMASFEPTLVDAINLEHAGSFRSKTSKSLATILGYRKKTKDMSVTNLTKLDIPEEYGEYKLDFFSFIPPVISYGKNIVGISTLGDCTVLTLHRIKKV